MKNDYPDLEQVPWEMRLSSLGWVGSGLLFALITFFQFMPRFLGLPPTESVDALGRLVSEPLLMQPVAVLVKCGVGAGAAMLPFLVFAVLDWRRTNVWRYDNEKVHLAGR